MGLRDIYYLYILYFYIYFFIFCVCILYFFFAGPTNQSTERNVMEKKRNIMQIERESV